MSLFRAASGPTGLLMNTTTANTPGTTTTTPAAGGLFGASTNNTPNTNSGGLFGSAPQNQGAASGLFGNAANNTTSTNTNTGSNPFGGAVSSTQQQPAGGLFGNSTAGQTQQNATGSGLFGASTLNQQQPQQQQQQSAAPGLFGGQQKPSGLFGAANNASNTSSGGGGLFGNSTANTGAQALATSGLFGNATSNQANTSAGGMFGNQASAQTQGGGGLFGNAQNQQPAQQNGGLFGNMGKGQPAAGGLLGQPANAMGGQSIAAAHINYDNLQGRTRFDDLAKPVQDEIVRLDTGIERIMQMYAEIQALLPKHRETIEALNRDVYFVETKYKRVESILRKDVTVVNALKEATKGDIENAQLALQAVENLKLPAQYHTPNLWVAQDKDTEKKVVHVTDLIGLFNKAVEDLDARHRKLTEYRVEIYNHLPNVENGLYERLRALRDGLPEWDESRNNLKTIMDVIMELNNTLKHEAGQCVETRDRLEQAGVRLPPIGYKPPAK